VENHVQLSAAILAGGQARRFGGRDKGSLVVDGRSIRARQLAELTTIAGDILIVGTSGAAGQGHAVGNGVGSRFGGDDSKRLPTPFPLRVVADRVPGCGPLGGLHTALLESAFDTTLVVACDMPYVSAPLLRYLATLARDADAVVPRTERGYHPLCAAYTRACLDPVARRLADGRLTMIELFEDVRVRVVDGTEIEAFGDARRLLANVNSPADHLELEAGQHQS
jgi:molybdenum cofactor guanylyltransferase